MLAYLPAKTEQYETFLQLTQVQAADYLERTLELMEMTGEEFGDLFRTVGQVYGIYKDSQLAGYFWIEEREAILHLHGLILKESFQGQGIGTQVLRELEARYGDCMVAIELGVHKSNHRAKQLYERTGYQIVKAIDELGFEIMQKQLQRI